MLLCLRLRLLVRLLLRLLLLLLLRLQLLLRRLLRMLLHLLLRLLLRTIGCASCARRTLHFRLVGVFIDAYHGGVGVILGRGWKNNCLAPAYGVAAPSQS